MAKATLLLGSNRGNRSELLSSAREKIYHTAGKHVAASSLYESEPWGFSDSTPFLNQVIIIDTALAPKALLKILLDTEMQLGRLRQNHTVYSSRTIDIDILFYDDLIIDDETLQVPHPRMQNRMFTLLPLLEVRPELIHPVLKKPVKALKEACPDTLRVEKCIAGPHPVNPAANEV